MIKKLLIVAFVAGTSFCMSAQKFGTINRGEIMQQMTEFAEAQSQLKTISEKYENEVKKLQEEFTKKQQEYEATDKDAATPQAVKERHAQELQDQYQKIQQFLQTADNDLQTQQQRLISPVVDKLNQAIQTVGQEGEFTFIYDLSVQSVIYSGAGTQDIAPLVKAKLGIK